MREQGSALLGIEFFCEWSVKVRSLEDDRGLWISGLDSELNDSLMNLEAV